MGSVGRLFAVRLLQRTWLESTAWPYTVLSVVSPSFSVFSPLSYLKKMSEIKAIDLQEELDIHQKSVKLYRFTFTG